MLTSRLQEACLSQFGFYVNYQKNDISSFASSVEESVCGAASLGLSGPLTTADCPNIVLAPCDNGLREAALNTWSSKRAGVRARGRSKMFRYAIRASPTRMVSELLCFPTRARLLAVVQRLLFTSVPAVEAEGATKKSRHVRWGQTGWKTT